ncbi:MAG: N(G),N(G)-dimethylarginine dimethylaminohydrolase, partial [Candidatus Marinimicrobia bacterium]|nr:N(G),N(G)-dimethylarginine dimethylaminohydrolase [Candidatus Neomarinimicrobiota bacterium]
MFKRAIVRPPGESMIHGVTSAKLGPPDYEKALLQHANYIEALEACGLEVVRLPPDEHFPDSTFIEDVALLTPHCAVITNPGAPTRRGEIQGLRNILQDYYSEIEQINSPGTVEAGDIMMVGDQYYIGLSERTNRTGAAQMIGFLEKYGMTGSTIELKQVLHLKTGLAYLENSNLIACGEFISHPEFQKFNILGIDASESYAANCIWVNGKILLPAGYPIARKTIESTGYQVLEIDTSEFRKLDGGLS